MTSDSLKAIIDLIPEDFADPEADFQAVRQTMAPFHDNPTDSDLRIEIKRCGWRSDQVGTGSTVMQRTPASRYTITVAPTCLVRWMFTIFTVSSFRRHWIYEWSCPTIGLAPEHPYPAASIDCLNAYRGLLEQGVPPEKIVVLGESCGGGLAVGALLQARDEGLPMPACFVSLTGWFDLNVTTASPGRDPFLTPEWVRNRGLDFTAGQLGLDDPRVSTCNAELQGLPHLYLQVGQYDTMGGRRPAAGRTRDSSWRSSFNGKLAGNDTRLAGAGECRCTRSQGSLVTDQALR